MLVQPISYSSNSLISAQTNTTDSEIKTKLDSWYKSNFTSYTSYLADEVFCNDRSISGGSGYVVSATTTYGAYGRLQDEKQPNLKCSGENNRFKVSNTSAKLDYPVGLITADEVAFAGGRAYYNANYSPNNNYYLYNGRYYWTFSASSFHISNSHAHVWTVMSSGSLHPWNYATDSLGIRPVINLKQNVTILKGDGSALNPFVLQS